MPYNPAVQPYSPTHTFTVFDEKRISRLMRRVESMCAESVRFEFSLNGQGYIEIKVVLLRAGMMHVCMHSWSPLDEAVTDDRYVVHTIWDLVLSVEQNFQDWKEGKQSPA